MQDNPKPRTVEELTAALDAERERACPNPNEHLAGWSAKCDDFMKRAEEAQKAEKVAADSAYEWSEKWHGLRQQLLEAQKEVANLEAGIRVLRAVIDKEDDKLEAAEAKIAANAGGRRVWGGGLRLLARLEPYPDSARTEVRKRAGRAAGRDEAMIEPPVFFCRSCGCWGDLLPVNLDGAREIVCIDCRWMLTCAYLRIPLR